LFKEEDRGAFAEGSLFHYLNYIIGQEDQADPSTERSALRRVHNALITAWEKGFDSVVVADTGGLPGYKELIRLCAVLVFGEEQVTVWRNQEAARRNPGPRAGPELQNVAFELMTDQGELAAFNGDLPRQEIINPRKLFSTLESEIRLRLLAIELIQRGDFEAADSVANVTGSAWAKGLLTAAQVITGIHRQYTVDISNYWVPGFKGKNLPAPLVVAFRVESALQRGAWPEAITRTAEFFEWAFTFALAIKLNQSLNEFLDDGDIRKISIEPGRALRGLRLGGDWKEINSALRLILVQEKPAGNGKYFRNFSTELSHRGNQHVLMSYEFNNYKDISPVSVTIGNNNNEKNIWIMHFTHVTLMV